MQMDQVANSASGRVLRSLVAQRELGCRRTATHHATHQLSPARVKSVYFAVQGHSLFRKGRCLQRVELRVGAVEIHELPMSAELRDRTLQQESDSSPPPMRAHLLEHRNFVRTSHRVEAVSDEADGTATLSVDILGERFL
jgi:hypothetical protein